MKRHTLTVLALSASLLSAGYVLGQSQAKSGSGATAAPKPPKLVKVATLNSVEANREFQGNVQLLQVQREAVIRLEEAIKQEKDAKKQKEMKAQQEQLLAKLNENNAQMQKAYGFSLSRNYTMEIEKSHIYLQVSDEEAAKIEKAQAEAAKQEKGKKK